ncbi:MAG: putative peptidoglycan binding domain [Parcubacteria group bacterium]|nr:putative peptidoglycan binding domain [Parcubacteria group bacterium]
MSALSHVFFGPIIKSVATVLMSFGATVSTTPTTEISPVIPATSLQDTVSSLHDQITTLRTSMEKSRLKNLLQQNLTSVASIKQTQIMLIDLGYLSKNISFGYYGPLTKKAIQDFQIQNNLPKTGTTDDSTINKLIEDFIAKENISNIYFPEENTLSSIANSTTSASETSIEQDTTATQDNIPPDPFVNEPTPIYDCPDTITSQAPATSTPSSPSQTSTTTTILNSIPKMIQPPKNATSQAVPVLKTILRSSIPTAPIVVPPSTSSRTTNTVSVPTSQLMNQNIEGSRK